MHRRSHHVELTYGLVKAPRSADLVLHPLFQMLDAVERRGSISAAARTLGLSYRHVWGELKRWEEEFGRLLIVWEKGQRARLTAFGQKLLWAERQAQSRLAPQISGLRADLERVFGLAFDDAAHVLLASASHDEALAVFRDFVQPSGLFLDLRFTGSLDALIALVERRVLFAGFHLPVPDQPLINGARASLIEAIRGVVGTSRLRVVHVSSREQGLIVESGNPLKIRGLDDLALGRFQFVNRPRHAGTRLILDGWAAQRGLSPDSIRGYRYEEPSHAAVAEAVRSGKADLGLGLSAAAHQRGLGFVPVFNEDYWLAFQADSESDEGVSRLTGLLSSPAWRTELSSMVGYRMPSQSDVIDLERLLGV